MANNYSSQQIATIQLFSFCAKRASRRRAKRKKKRVKENCSQQRQIKCWGCWGWGTRESSEHMGQRGNGESKGQQSRTRNLVPFDRGTLKFRFFCCLFLFYERLNCKHCKCQCIYTKDGDTHTHCHKSIKQT